MRARPLFWLLAGLVGAGALGWIAIWGYAPVGIEWMMQSLPWCG